jgi:RHS repeat-associated protein
LIHFAPTKTINSRFDYTYDSLGRRGSVTTLDGTTTYTYDSDSRLISLALPSGRVINYVYDAVGNRIGATDNGAATAYTANSVNEYVRIGATTESYDAAGDLLNVSGGASYSYDALNRLAAIAGAQGAYTYEYDALGHRSAIVRNGDRTEFVFEPSGYPLAEYDSTGQLIAHYTYGLALVSRVNGVGAAAYYDFDALGSTVGLTGATGGYINRYDYLPFGEPLSAVEGVPNRFRFIGASAVQDDQSGLDFMGARFYSPSQGRFIQPDPIGLQGGSNLYAYASNDPV